MRTRGPIAVASGVVFLVLGAISYAWACTPSAATTLSAPSGAAEERVTMNGTAFHKGVPVEIRWNSVSGPVLATATGPDFSLPVTIPADAKPDAYYLFAVQHDDRGNVIGRGASTFDVIAGRPGIAAPSVADQPRAGSAASPSSGLDTSPASATDDRLPLLGLGAALAAVGAVALFAGFGVVGVRRRHARASS